MPVDPKYSGLPGIAWDQPDTFETVETGENEDIIEHQERSNIDDEKLHMASLSWLDKLEVGVEEVKIVHFNIFNLLC